MAADQKLAESYQPANGMGKAAYQNVQWATFTQTFATAISSNTGPAVSSGSGTQAFQYAAQGKIAYADRLVESMKSNGLYDDFQPGLVEALKVKEGYAAVPYMIDMRLLWQNKQLMEKAGAETPTDWQSYLNACQALKKIDVYGFGTGGGAGSSLAAQTIHSLLINNSGGLFDDEQQPNCVTQENIEAVDFVLELVSKGYADPASISYTTENVKSQWAAGRFGMGWFVCLPGGVVNDVNTDVGRALEIGEPLTGARGDKGTIMFIANLMMYKNTPSQENSEAFLTYYLQNMSKLWTQDTGIGLLPVLKSIAATKEYQANKYATRALEKWLPIAKTQGAPAKGVFLNVVASDGTKAMNNFAQKILSNQTNAKDALTALQSELKSTLPKAS
ncbi:ABC transporter substrate-binding protein [Paenarthrobacter sp. NPDC057981]|uniref:ABC transporter substrate-binding protein n=1 Tax=Paenarthrobacter sp. NPDC057981 TaxID=3346297 RepID=UPI0036DBF424